MTETFDWREQAEALFFMEHMTVNDVAMIVGKSRRHVAQALKESGRFSYEEEKEQRKQLHAQNRKKYQREWDRENRSRYTEGVTAETMRREHDTAAAILSYEKYY